MSFCFFFFFSVPLSYSIPPDRGIFKVVEVWHHKSIRFHTFAVSSFFAIACRCLPPRIPRDQEWERP